MVSGVLYVGHRVWFVRVVSVVDEIVGIIIVISVVAHAT